MQRCPGDPRDCDQAEEEKETETRQRIGNVTFAKSQVKVGGPVVPRDLGRNPGRRRQILVARPCTYNCSPTPFDARGELQP